MHIVFRESHGLEETATPIDLGQTPADLVVLSFSDSDLGAFAAAWHQGGGPSGDLPTLRLANLAALRHPVSVDTYIENTLSGAKGILIRLIGGVPYWSYGLQQVLACAQAHGIALAVLPGDGRMDDQLDAHSTLPVSTLRRLSHLCDMGGAAAAQAALGQLALASGLYARPARGVKTLSLVGAWSPDCGLTCAAAAQMGAPTDWDRPVIAITFYRSYLVAADLAPVGAIWQRLLALGYRPVALFAPSLKAPEAAGWLARQIRTLRPKAIINATSFSGIGADGASPLDAAEVPVFQVALATSNRKAWADAARGLSPADLAMHVVLPEVDGRLFGGVVSFKEPGAKDPDLQFARMGHQAEDARVAAVCDRVDAWVRLGELSPAQRRVGLVLSTYPGKDWNMGHAVGLDAPASALAMLQDLHAAGYDLGGADLDQLTSTGLSHALLAAKARFDLADYKAALNRLPQQLRDDLAAAWGAPEDDPACDGAAFTFPALQMGRITLAMQPERGGGPDRGETYHDLARVPCHAYVAFYLWQRSQIDALVHIGAHGTLEWLPGKSVALSGACWPEALIGDCPVIYPFIVNDPGEAAQAKRRIGAVTLGHVPPPMAVAGSSDRLTHLESLLDEFSNADGLDPRRRDRLQDDIRAEASALGLDADLGLDSATCTAEAIGRIDRFVCDVKDSQFGHGLHIWGRGAPTLDAGDLMMRPSLSAERQSLLDALDGRRIAAGPSGSPYRGRVDVLPTGRNLYTTDPRGVPTRAAWAQGVKLADELVRRHLQDHGDWPRGLVVDLWGSATMRTAGEDFAMALALLGVRPTWDALSSRVTGIEVLPIAELDRPRIDVTLRVSGLFRDVFATLPQLFGQAVAALAARDEAADWNPSVGRDDLARVYAPAPASFGVDMGAAAQDYTDAGRSAAGQAWLDASAWAIDAGVARHDPAGLAARVTAADSFVHTQDLPETDLLLARDYASHEGGFAAAKTMLGGQAALYHLDNTDPNNPRTRELGEEIARVVLARASNPKWLGGMTQHGFRGAAEIAATLEHMAEFAHFADRVPGHLFDLYYEATLGDEDIHAFLAAENPAALAAMQDRFAALMDAGLWQTRRNSIRAMMGADG